MIRLFINGLAASAGGGLTYLRNVIPQLGCRKDVEATVALNPALRQEFGEFPNISFADASISGGTVGRFVREQTMLPRLIRRSGAQVLISAGNFALWRSPIPQILLSRNSLYTSDDFIRDVRSRGDYAIWGDTLIKGWLARRSLAGRDKDLMHIGGDKSVINSTRTPHGADSISDRLRRLIFSLQNPIRAFSKSLD